jgi:hypothetical protein
MISGLENIRDIFSIFHDGAIIKWEKQGSGIEIIVEIPYLTKMICKSYEWFSLTLYDVNQMAFETWPHAGTVKPWLINNLDDIFKLELEILSAELENNLQKITCNQHSTEFEYCGGYLRFSCVDAAVRDPSGKEYSIDDLDKICNEYWDAWAARN